MPGERGDLSDVATRVDGFVPTVPERKSEVDDVGPARIGRYVVLRKLGEGGMGVVYAAYDEMLDRKVAIKLLRGEFRGRQQSVGQQRLFREAQSMAKLSHPNVAQVYEVAPLGDAVYIAMEFVSGANLTEWLTQEKRPWREIVVVFRQAGEGLAAAHRAGIVHRDFKPDNVLVGDDGRVRVADFGLARRDEATTVVDDGVTTSVDSHLTQVGTFIGTPAYMAPEQLRREPADALSDQFSFCVSLFEGLYGYRPFKGETTAEITRAVLAGERQSPPRDTDVPGWVHQVIVRGLSLEPAERFPTMDALLAALSADPERARGRRRGILGAILGAGLVAGSSGYAIYEVRAREEARCTGAREQLAGVWDAAVAAQVKAALTSSKAGYAADVAARVDRRLGEYADAWVEMRREACEAHRRGEQSDSLYDRRVACLDGRRTALRALVDVLAAADPEALEKAVQASEQLPPLSRCADAQALLAQSPPPDDPALARAAAALRERLARAQARFDVGQYRATQEELASLRAEAEALGHAPTLAAVLYLAGRVEEALGLYAEAEASLLRAAATADRGGDDEVRAGAMIELVRVVGTRQARFDEGLRLGEFARGVVARLPDDLQAEATLASRLGELLLQRGELDQAEPHLARALELRAQIDGETSSAYAEALDTRATLAFFRGDYEAALAGYRAAVAIYETTYGAAHPRLGKALNNIGAAELSSLRYRDAEATHTRVLEILRGAYGESHPALAHAYSNLGLIAQLQGHYPQAIASFERALAIYEAHLPPSHPNRGDCLLDLGHAHVFAGAYAEAERQFARALAIYGEAFGVGHAKTTQALASLGMAQLRDGRADEASRTFQRALAEFTGPADDPALAAPLAGLGQVLLAAGRVREAAEKLERALELVAKNPSAAPYEVAEIQFALARALSDPGSAERRRELAEAARAGYRAIGPAFAAAAAEVDAWLTSSAPPRGTEG
ncbi:MAG TPA: tetratricopeptide repeat protein [Nannocystis sp.]